jgi:cytochrome c
MKKLHAIFSFVLLVFFALGCNSHDEKKTSTAVVPPAPVASSGISDEARANPNYDAGLKLAAKSGCFTCHNIKDQLIGPAYDAIAAKYDNTSANVSMLAGKIIKGGQGVWGEVPMTAHPDVSKADAETMVKYIMLLKK